MDRLKIDSWANEVQVDENLRALADSKVVIDNYKEKGYSYDWELDMIISQIEDACKVVKNKNEDVKKVLNRIKEHYELIGRKEGYSRQPLKKILLKDLTKYFNSFEIPNNYMVISRLKFKQEDPLEWYDYYA